MQIGAAGKSDDPAGHLSSVGVEVPNLIKTKVIIRGRKYPQVGRVCMDQSMLQLDQAPVAHAGDEVVDAKGDLAALTAGTTVLPSGCTSADCATAWDGSGPLKMDQLKLTYKLLPDLKWSDGAPLTAADSIYSYQLSGDPDTPVSRIASPSTLTMHSRTASETNR